MYHDYKPVFGGETQGRDVAYSVFPVLFMIDGMSFVSEKGKC